MHIYTTQSMELFLGISSSTSSPNVNFQSWNPIFLLKYKTHLKLPNKLQFQEKQSLSVSVVILFKDDKLSSYDFRLLDDLSMPLTFPTRRSFWREIDDKYFITLNEKNWMRNNVEMSARVKMVKMIGPHDPYLYKFLRTCNTLKTVIFDTIQREMEGDASHSASELTTRLTRWHDLS